MSRWTLKTLPEGEETRWPTEAQRFLILDGVRVEKLAKHLYAWAGDNAWEGDLLYAGTPWAAMSDISPWLIALSGPQDPILTRYLDEGLEAEWGYLIDSSASLMTLSHHLRRLLQVRSAAGTPVLLRLADPAVMASLLADGSDPTVTPWGPIEQLLLPDDVQECWLRSSPREDTRPCDNIPPTGYRLNDTQEQQLKACDQRRDLRALYRFTDRYCPDWLPSNRLARYEVLSAILGEARQYGYLTPREWGVLCTLFAQRQCLSWEALKTQWPAVYRQLTANLEGGAMARLEQARLLSHSFTKTT
ncbi:DUF4123 domain-containing protein [Halomonas dongshanensis]|uniref:DUF4123 domain-containing protein n=1 Tax=Halomonas dongshanensis TaxID=2890835 RepID=A0ABT2EI77_9GAMM|nr:DUF4123 domain-containing protein [Halomonas dongshanensis]MCS2610805.1 DUF4123 domain-containing protein [Halomonas dongshanensis]